MICKILLLSTLVACASALQCTKCTESYTTMFGERQGGTSEPCAVSTCVGDTNACMRIELSAVITMNMEGQSMSMPFHMTTRDCNNYLYTCEAAEEQIPEIPSATIHISGCNKTTCMFDNCNAGDTEKSSGGDADGDGGSDGDGGYDYYDYEDYKSKAEQAFLSTVMFGVVLFKLF